MPKANTVSEVFVFERDEDMEIFGGELYSGDSVLVVVNMDASETCSVKFETSLDKEVWFPFCMFPTGGGPAISETYESGAFRSDYVGYWTRFRTEGLTGENVTVQYNLVMDK